MANFIVFIMIEAIETGFFGLTTISETENHGNDEEGEQDLGHKIF